MKIKNSKDTKIKILALFLVIALFSTKSVLADSIIDIHNFKIVLAACGDKEEIMDDELEMKVGYIKVDIKTEHGDKYDVKLKYSKNYLRSTKVFAVKKGLSAKGKSSTIYFIPKKGKCPGKKSECVRVPVIPGISTNTRLIDSKRIMYGVEIYNGSAFGGNLKIKGSFKFINYDEKEKVD